MSTVRLPKSFILLPEVANALRTSQPVVALESAVITHGLPRPQNLELARQLEVEVRAQGATPATVGLLQGKIHISKTVVDNKVNVSQLDPGLYFLTTKDGDLNCTLKFIKSSTR